MEMSNRCSDCLPSVMGRKDVLRYGYRVRLRSWSHQRRWLRTVAIASHSPAVLLEFFYFQLVRSPVLWGS